MSLLHRIAIAAKGERKDEANRLITKGQANTDDAFNASMDAAIAKMTAAAIKDMKGM